GWLLWEYEDGSIEKVSIIVGVTTGRFWSSPTGLKEQEGYPEPVWSVIEEAVIGGKEDRVLRLYEQSWVNPRPHLFVKSLAFESNRESTASPFLVAVTLSP